MFNSKLIIWELIFPSIFYILYFLYYYIIFFISHIFTVNKFIAFLKLRLV